MSSDYGCLFGKPFFVLFWVCNFDTQRGFTMENKGTFITARITGGELRKLDIAAAKSGRSRSDAVRRLIAWIDTAEGRRVLGVLNEPTTDKK